MTPASDAGRERERNGEPMDTPAAPAARPHTVPGRDRYLDLLRALALVRVVAFHAFNAVWLGLVFPAMGVMFALAGSLMVRSLDGPTPGVFARRARRLLLPLWAYAAVVLALYAWAGWRPLEEGVSWPELLLWFVPICAPPFPEDLVATGALGALWEEWPAYAWVILWYIRTYFWLVLLSPLLLRAFRRRPWATLAGPLLLNALLHLELVPLPWWADAPLWDLATYGACWVLGFAHRDGRLHALRPGTVALLGAGSMALGLLWAVTHPAEEGLDLTAIPLGQALWSLGFVAILLRLSPAWDTFPGPLRFLDRPVTLLNNRALTVYLWHYLLLAAVYPLVDLLWDSAWLAETVPWLLESDWPNFLAVWIALAPVILAVGWVEDVAARRPPRWWPDGAARGGAARGRHLS